MSRRPGFQFGGLQGFRKFTLAPEPGDKLTNRAEPVYPPIPVESMETWGSVEADPRQPEEAVPARAIRIAREVAPPVAAAPIARRAAPVVAEPESRELTIPVNRPSQDDTARALWEIFNRTENPADFVRADLATPRPAARAGGTVDRALRVAREAGGSLGAYVDPVGGMMQTGDAEGPAPRWYETAAGIAERSGRAVGEPMRVAAEDYLRNVGKAFQESRDAIDQSGRDITGERGPLPQAGAPINYGLGVLGMGLSPLTGAAMSAGHAATQMTGNPQIGQRVEFLGNVIDPSHIGLAAKSAMAVGPMARALEVAREAQAPARELSPLGFYSHGYETAGALPQAKGTPEQIAAMLERQGVKPVEMGGFREAFAGRPSMTREEAAEYFRGRMPQIEETVLGRSGQAPIKFEQYKQLLKDMDKRELLPDELAKVGAYEKWTNVQEPKYKQYTLPGGENYREVLLRTPPDRSDILQFKVVRPDGHVDSTYVTAESAQARADQIGGSVRQGETINAVGGYRSSHWNEPNVLAHMRMSDRTGPQGEKVLHLEEMQSDWAQEGRKHGFKTPVQMENLVESRPSGYPEDVKRLMSENWYVGEKGSLLSDKFPKSEYPTLEAAKKAYVEKNRISKKGLPTAPYVTKTEDWTNLALKRALREAAEGGYDKLVWTPGAEQAKRYDLSKQIDAINYGLSKDGKTVSIEAVRDGENVFNRANMPVQDLDGLVGREVADKIRKGSGEVDPNTGYNVLSGLDLSVGGEGMKGYYDKIVPTALQKLLKKLDPGAKVGKTGMEAGDGYKLVLPNGKVVHEAMNEKDLVPHMKSFPGARIEKPFMEMPSVQITPAMREAILRGLPAYADGGSVVDRALRVARKTGGEVSKTRN